MSSEMGVGVWRTTAGLGSRWESLGELGFDRPQEAHCRAPLDDAAGRRVRPPSKPKQGNHMLIPPLSRKKKKRKDAGGCRAWLPNVPTYSTAHAHVMSIGFVSRLVQI
jgi:hypothetical protein